MANKKVKVLITGGAGFIGSKLSKRLIQLNYEVIIIDNLSTGIKKNIPKESRFIKGDLSIDNVYKKIPNDIRYIFHFAAQSSGEISFEDPEYDLRCNVLSTLKILNWSKKNKIKRLIFSSSMNIYGNVDDKKIDENYPANPISFYGIGKYSSEKYIKIYSELGVKSTILRFFNIYGPGQNLDNLKQGMISIYLSYILKNKVLKIKGSLNRFRDFVYIDDLLDACIKALKENNNLSLYNVCSNRKITVKKLIKIIFQVMNIKNYKYYVEKGTPLDQFGIYGNNKKIYNDLKWKPKISLEEGIRKMVDEL